MSTYFRGDLMGGDQKADIKVRHLSGDTYQVLKLYIDDGICDDLQVLHQGCLSDCEAYIRLKANGYLE